MKLLRALLLIGWTAICCGIGLVVVMVWKDAANWVLMRIGRDLWSTRMMRWTGTNRFEARGPGSDAIPAQAIFIANHCSFLDINALFAFLHRPIVFLAKASLRKVPLLGGVNARVGTVFVKRGNLQDSIRAVKALKRSFDKGRSVVVFPEGTRSRTGEMLSFKKGAFHLAHAAGEPVIPVFIAGTHHVLRSGGFLVNKGPIRVYVGEPVAPSPYVEDFMRAGEEAVRDLKALAQAESLQ